MVIGYGERDINEWQHTRRIAYQIVRSYADPKQVPPTEQHWMPLTKEDLRATKPIKFTKRQKEKIKEKLNNVNWQRITKKNGND